VNIIKEKCTKLVSIHVIVYQMPGTVSVETVNRVCEMIGGRALHWGGGGFALCDADYEWRRQGSVQFLYISRV
jgi:hypothetical protein